jgi:peroxiredoxin
MTTRNIFINLFFAISILACSGPKSSEKPTEPENISTRNDLPKMVITSFDGTQVDVRELKGNSVLILFQPDCDHCQREAKEIRENLDAFKNYNLYFISADQMPAVEKFAKDYDLLGHNNINFGMTTVQHVLDNFGPIDAPSVYIYVNQQLQHKFNGETPIAKILEVV